MPQWYCAIQGNQYGPVDEPTIRMWISQGRIGPTDVVWCEGMSHWVPAARQFPDMFAPGTPGTSGAPGYGGYDYGFAGPQLVPVASPGGTSGMTPNGMLTAQAREVLRGRWGLPIGLCLLALLIVTAVPLGSLIFGGPITVGVAAFFLTLVRGGNVELGMLFAGFKRFGTALGAHLLIFVMILGWMLLGFLPAVILIIAGFVSDEPTLAIAGMFLFLPGYILPIVKSLGYSQALIIIADDDNVGAWDAIERSVEIMRGRKGKLFLLGLRFFAWMLLAFIPGILLAILGGLSGEPAAILPGIVLIYVGPFVMSIWLTPYMNTTYARFYDDLQPPRQIQVAAMPAVAAPAQF